MREYIIFRDCIHFLKQNSFKIFDYIEIEEFYKRFKKKVEERFHEKKIEQFGEKFLKFTILQYLGYDTKYGLNYDFDMPACKQIWSYVPYVYKTTYRNHFEWINHNLARTLNRNIIVSNISHKELEHKVFLTFSYKGKTYSIEGENLTMLSCEYIFRVCKLTKSKGDTKASNLYILDYGSIDDILFSCNRSVLESIIEYFDLDYKRIQ